MRKMLKKLGVVIPSVVLTLLMAVGFSTPAFSMRWHLSKRHCRRWSADWKPYSSSWQKQRKKCSVRSRRRRN